MAAQACVTGTVPLANCPSSPSPSYSHDASLFLNGCPVKLAGIFPHSPRGGNWLVNLWVCPNQHLPHAPDTTADSNNQNVYTVEWEQQLDQCRAGLLPALLPSINICCGSLWSVPHPILHGCRFIASVLPPSWFHPLLSIWSSCSLAVDKSNDWTKAVVSSDLWTSHNG